MDYLITVDQESKHDYSWSVYTLYEKSGRPPNLMNDYTIMHQGVKWLKLVSGRTMTFAAAKRVANRRIRSLEQKRLKTKPKTTHYDIVKLG